MKYLAALFMLIALSKEGVANNVVYAPQIAVQPQTITMVYQVPYLIVTVPVPVQAVYTQQVIYWGYPYYQVTPVQTIEHRYRRRCWHY